MKFTIWNDQTLEREVYNNIVDIHFEYQEQNGKSYWLFYTKEGKNKLDVLNEHAIEIDIKHDHITII